MSTIYYKIPKDSEIGIKLQELEKEVNEINKRAEKLQEKYKADGFTYHNSGFEFHGGFNAFFFKEVVPDSKLFKEVQWNWYRPKKNTKEGKAIAKEMEEVGEISIFRLDDIFNPKKKHKHNYLFSIGVSWERDGFFKILYNSDRFMVKSLNEYEEITLSEYKK